MVGKSLEKELCRKSLPGRTITLAVRFSKPAHRERRRGMIALHTSQDVIPAASEENYSLNGLLLLSLQSRFADGRAGGESMEKGNWKAASRMV